MIPLRTAFTTAVLSLAFLQQIGAQVHREWIQSSAPEFLAGTFNHTMVTDSSGGEIRLLDPLYKNVADSLIPGRELQFIGLDSAGTYVRAWQAHDSIVVQRFDAGGDPLSPPMRVNDSAKALIYTLSPRCALMDNGYYYVGWISADSIKVYGQLFGPGDAKIGPILCITGSNGMDMFANNHDSTFWIVTVNRTLTEPDTTAILAWRIGLTGEFAGPEPKRLQERIAPQGIRSVRSQTTFGDFMLAWIAFGGNVGGVEETLFVQRFDRSGSPLQQPRIVNDFLGWGVSSPCLAFDDSGRYLAVWEDNRNDQPGHYNFDIYAQLFDYDDTPVKRNFMVNSPLGAGNTEGRWPDLHFRNGDYRISWVSWNAQAYRYDVYANTWSYFFGRSGEYRSPVYDSGPLIIDYDSLYRNAELPAEASVKFRIRSAATLPELDTAGWYGPGKSSESFYTAVGEPVGAGHALNRLIQYTAYLEGPERGVTPVLSDVRLTYRIESVAPPEPPAAASLQPAHGRITIVWQPSPSPAIAQYRIYRGTASGSYDPGWTRSVPATTHEYTDTTLLLGTTYFYAVNAVDSNLQESGLSDEVSGHTEIITLYVSVEAGDTRNGTFEFPFRTIQEATSQALEYDTVFVLPGTYEGMVRIPARVSLIGSGAPYTTIAAGGDSNVVRCGHQSVLRGFTIRQTGAVTQWCAVWCGNSEPTIEENVIVNMVPESYPVDFAGIEANGGNPVIRRNYVVDFESCISLSKDDDDGMSALIANNIVVSRLVGIHLSNHADATIINNTVSITRPYGAGVWAFPVPSAIVTNNIIVSSEMTGMAFSTSCYLPQVALTVDYNDAWNFLTRYECVNPGSGNISVDPLFVNPAAGDYRLATGSPCRDAGMPGSEYNDADGSRNDLGAFGGPDPIDYAMFSGFDVSFGIGSTSGFPGDTVGVDLYIVHGARLARAECTVEFESAIIGPVSVQRTSLADSMELGVDTAIPGAMSIHLTGPAGQGAGTGNIVHMVFRIDPAAQPNQASPLVLTGVSLRDGDGAELAPTELSHGAVVVSPGIDGGRYVFVDRRSGSGTEDGTRAHPWKSIQGAVAHASPGDTVLVAAGVYEEMVFMPDSVHLRGSGATITTLRVDSANATFIQPAVRFSSSHGSSLGRMTLTTGPGELSLASGPVEAEFSAFEISECLITSSGNPNTPLLWIMHGSAASIHDNLFTGGLGPNGLILVSDSSFADIRRNDFGQTDLSIDVVNARGTIQNNKFLTAGAGEAEIIVDSPFPVSIRNNVLESMNNRGILVTRGDSTVILNNTLVGGFTGIETSDPDVRALSNIVTGNVYGIVMETDGMSDFNDAWGNLNNYFGASPGQDDISANPEFVDSDAHDFRLSAASPCRDAGNPDPDFNDLDGTRNDIGAFGGPGLDTTFFNPRGATLRITGVLEQSADTLGVPIAGSCLGGTATAEITIAYDPIRLTFTGAQTTPATAMFALRQSVPYPGTVSLRLTSPRRIDGDSAMITVLHFVPVARTMTTTLRLRSAKLLKETTSEIPVSELLDGQIVLTGVDGGAELPASYELEQNYPNPFNPSTTLRYSLPVRSRVTLRIFDMLGREILTLIDDVRNAGLESVEWNGVDTRGFRVSSGVYICRIEAVGVSGNGERFTGVRKLVLLR